MKKLLSAPCWLLVGIVLGSGVSWAKEAEVVEGVIDARTSVKPLPNPSGKIPDLNEQVMNLTFQAITGYDLTNDLPQIRKKIMILWGADDPVGPDVANTTKTALSGAQAELIVIKECGHFWQEKPREFLTRIRAFLIPGTK